MGKELTRKPKHLQFKIPGGEQYNKIKKTLQDENLHTICTEAKCPNIGECFCNGTATFLILGNTCTRNCHYCAVVNDLPPKPDQQEPAKIGRAIAKLQIKYAVITSVTRDDLPDGGASHFVKTVEAIRSTSPECQIELLIPDFANSVELSLNKIIAIEPDVINHNIETTKNIFPLLRPQGNYNLSLEIIQSISKSSIISKSGLMIGFGETIEDIKSTLFDLHKSGCQVITIGQYLQATKDGYPVKKYYTETEFEKIEQIAVQIGFDHVSCGPLVRSSYHAAQILK